MLIELLHVVASGSEVLAGVELTGLLNEDLADGSGHGQTRVGVDVDLANGRCGSLAELFFGDTHCVGELTTVLVDGVHFFLGHRRRTVEHDGECGELLFDSSEHVECEGGRNETTGLGVAGALFGLELVSTVARTNGDSERVATRAFYEFDHLFGLRVVALFVSNFVFHTGEYTEFSLNRHIVSVSVFNDLLGERDVLFEGKCRSVDHHRAEARVNAALAGFEAVTVVEVEADFGMLATEFLSVSHSTLCHVAKQRGVGIFACSLRYLKDHGALFSNSSLDDGLELLHIVEVESGNCITAFYGTGEHFASVHQTEIFVIYHNYMS